MATPKLQKNWTVTPNVARAYTSLLDSAGYWAYRLKVAALAAGWVMWWSCDGTTGPTNSADHTDRITDQTKFAVRNASGASLHSWYVIKNVDGCMLRVSYLASSDDVVLGAYSEGGTFVLGAPTYTAPAGTDDVSWTSFNSIVGSTTAGQRMFQFWATNESIAWAAFRAGTCESYAGFEKFDCVIPTAIKPLPYMGFFYTNLSCDTNQNTVSGAISGTAVQSVGWKGAVCRHTYGGVARISRMTSPFACAMPPGGGAPSVTQVALTNTPAMQNGGAIPTFPLRWQGERSTNLDGYAGDPIDWWYAFGTDTSTPALSDFMPGLDYADLTSDPTRANWLVALGPGLIRPWKNAAVSFLTA